MESTTLQWLVQQFSAIEIRWVEKTDSSFLEWQTNNELYEEDISKVDNKIACVSGFFSKTQYYMELNENQQNLRTLPKKRSSHLVVLADLK